MSFVKFNAWSAVAFNSVCIVRIAIIAMFGNRSKQSRKRRNVDVISVTCTAITE